MGIVLLDMAVSLDGIVTGQDGKSLYPMEQLQDTQAMNKLINATGAVILDQEAYDMEGGDFTGYLYQSPLFILTDTPPEKIALGENDKLRFCFVTEGAQQAVEYAKRAAAHLNITIVGSVNAARLCLKANLVDEILLRHIPVLVGKGEKLFEDLGERTVNLKIIHSMAYASRMDIRYRVLK